MFLLSADAKELRVNLKPCPYRHADDDGHILCDKIKSGDREVTPNICRACPVAQINCTHLRAALDHQARPPIVVRWGNGKSQVWDDLPHDSPALTRAVCVEKVIPIHSPRDCGGCALHQALVNREQLTLNSQPTADRRRPTVVPRTPRVVPAPVAQMAQPQPVAEGNQAAPTADACSNSVAQKIIQLQAWLAKPNRTPHQAEEEDVASVTYTQRLCARVGGEEKRVGWTD